MTASIPRNYTEWRHCIEVDCAIAITEDFVKARLTALTNKSAEETTRFIRVYGEPHWQNVLDWFGQAQSEFNNANER